MTYKTDVVGPPTLYEALLKKFMRCGFSYNVSDDLAERAEQVAVNWTASPREVNAQCCVDMTPEVVADDDPTVFAIMCSSCDADLAFIINRHPQSIRDFE